MTAYIEVVSFQTKKKEQPFKKPKTKNQIKMSVEPETVRSNFVQACMIMAELISVAMDLDDIKLGVKGQSSTVIAGFLRKLYR